MTLKLAIPLAILSVCAVVIGEDRKPATKPAKKPVTTETKPDTKPSVKQADRYKMYQTQSIDMENVSGTNAWGDFAGSKTLRIKLIVNFPPDDKGFAPSPRTLICHFFDHKKNLLKSVPGVAVTLTTDPNSAGHTVIKATPPTFRAKAPTDVYFPHDPNLRWTQAIIVVGDGEEAETLGHPKPLRDLSDYEFPGKSQLKGK